MAYVGASREPAGCVFCVARDGGDDRAGLVVERGVHAFLILNAYPYAPGHLMAVLNRHVGAIAEVPADELAGTMRMVQRAIQALAAEYRAEGFNVGLNIGRVAGAGIDDHLHVHVVPRWSGDTNFMSVLDGTRVVPEDLGVTWERLRKRLA
jgi:ATP adenylyltransferase